jgi:hypothetical protein
MHQRARPIEDLEFSPWKKFDFTKQGLLLKSKSFRAFQRDQRVQEPPKFSNTYD